MKKRSLVLSASVATALVVATAAPALASPWDGNNIDFGYGRSWNIGTSMYINDVQLGDSVVALGAETGGVYTDIWDGNLRFKVTSPTLGLNETDYACAAVEDVDVTVSDDGDLVLDCTTRWTAVSNTDVDIHANVRIYGPAGDLVRSTLTIVNNSGSDITDLSVQTYTNFGSTGTLAGYQNFDETVIAAEAAEVAENRDLLNSLGAQWIVHNEIDDAPGSLAWGNAGGEILTYLVDPTNGDSYYTNTETFTVAAGETAHLVYFTGWNPDMLVADEYANDESLSPETVADLVADAAEFDDFSGRLVRGLPEGANVLNWGPIETVEPVEEELAETGADVSTLWIALGLLGAAAATVVARRRARA
ncbi:LPXTG-motif cell wall-anchored protein [Microbacteriaceae bacterium MWH-Ta3]|nr:LPXTG-motif cell wall-anchored protein [Microbacteriaceae bacterium MWH-Ta3]